MLRSAETQNMPQADVVIKGRCAQASERKALPYKELPIVAASAAHVNSAKFLRSRSPAAWLFSG
jgi:hypothetical protein